MNDTLKMLLLIGAGAGGMFLWCKNQRSNPDEDMEKLLTDRLHSLESSSTSSPIKYNPHAGPTTDTDMRLDYLEKAYERMRQEQRQARRLRDDFDED